MTDQADIVIIGGGVTGCSIAYHLAKLTGGTGRIVLIDKGELTSGSTHHAAGLVTQYNPSQTMMRFRRYSIELYHELDVFEQTGSLRIASTPEQLAEMRRGVSRARGIGLDVELLEPEAALARMPAASPDALHGGIWVPEDGWLDPHRTTYALANAARALGVEIIQHCRVTGIDRGYHGEIVGVRTEDGRIATEQVVNAAGMWAPRVCAMVGGWVPSTPVDHQHIALAAVEGHELPRDMPCFRDPDNLVYGKAEAGGVLFGGYEPNAPARWIDGVPWEHSARTVPADEERFVQLMEGAIRRFPFLERAGVVSLICHPDAMTPDANPLLGPMPGVPGFWIAAGLSLNGFGGAGGMGKTLAEWMIHGETEWDVSGYRPWRFPDVYRDPKHAALAGEETYRYYYRLRYPYDQDERGRPTRLSALHSRLQEAGTVFGVKSGFERAEYVEPGRPWRRMGADQREWGWGRMPFFDVIGEEHRALRETAGLIDLSSFGKLAIEGPDACALLQFACDAELDRPVGSVIYTQMLDHRGGVVADVTVTRLAEDRYRMVTGAGAVATDRGWLAGIAHRAQYDVTIREVSDELAVIGIWGPRAKAIMAAVTTADLTNEAFPFGTGQDLLIGSAPAFAQRITYVGEFGYELYVEHAWATAVWDALLAAGGEHGIRVCGYRALDGLRMEKGYRYIGTDLTPGDTPDQAGLAFCARKEADYIGKDALEARRAEGFATRIRTLVIGDGDWLPVYGGEAVSLDGAVVSRVRSAAYGYTAGRMLAFAYLPIDLPEGAEVTVETLDGEATAVVAADRLVDPAGDRMR
jgi:4-methylaminobutanoate oxidase (formaldehyde-forming)